MKNLDQFVNYFLDCYEDTDITKKEVKEYTKLFIKLFPNLWGGGDSFDRENIYKILLMGRGDALAKKHNEQEVT